VTPENLEQVAAELKKLSERLLQEPPPVLPAARATKIRAAITETYTKLRKVVEDLDPVKPPEFVFDPSNPNVVGRFIGVAMIAQTRKPLAAVQRFYGSGIYAIYYKGDFPAYKGISNREHPIYVGKADPVVPSAKTPVEQGDRLSNRLSDHRRNIGKAESLRLDDFDYRALVVQSGWQEAAESYLIDLFRPIWNKEVGIVYGFGKHGDDPGTRANLRSPWDTLHPGRDWAHRDSAMKDAKPRKQILEEISSHLSEHPVFRTVDQVLRRFLEEMRTLT
jgi:hypothetical protein